MLGTLDRHGATRLAMTKMSDLNKTHHALADTFLLASVTPIARDLVHTRFAFTQPKADVDGPRGSLAKAFVQEIVRQLNEDIPIWENKRYLPQMRLCDGDGPIMDVRHWFKQFLIEGAP